MKLKQECHVIQNYVELQRIKKAMSEVVQLILI